MYTRYSQWLFDNFNITGHQISKYITSVQTYHKRNFITLNRLSMGTLAMQLKCLKKLRPKQTRTICPIVAKILRLWLPDYLKSHDTWYVATAMVMAYAHMLRAGEYVCSGAKYSENVLYRLNWNDITIGYNEYQIPTILQVRIKLPKSYSHKFRPEFVISECTCKSLGFFVHYICLLNISILKNLLIYLVRFLQVDLVDG